MIEFDEVTYVRIYGALVSDLTRSARLVPGDDTGGLVVILICQEKESIAALIDGS